jgi:hypothetical protein
VLVAAGAAASSAGCSSSHYLGDVAPPDVVGDPGDGALGAGDRIAAPLLGDPDLTMDGESPSSNPLLTRLGDVDGDGYADIASRGNEEFVGEHYIHIRYGGPRPMDRVEAYLFAIQGPRLLLGIGDAMIENIEPAGDLDGDGYADFLVRSAGCDREGVLDGVFLFYGGPDRIASGWLAERSVYLPRPHLGYQDSGCGALEVDVPSVEVGDMDGDGFDDLVLIDTEIPRDTYPGEATAYVFYGRRERLAEGTFWSSADARLTIDTYGMLVSLGDVDADGLADVAIGNRKSTEFVTSPEYGGSYWWLRGRKERLSGDMPLDAVATPFAVPVPAGDLDGDGLSDVVLYDANATPHLFYGELGLFGDGVNFAEAAAVIEPYAAPSGTLLSAGGDLDGDGDDELVSAAVLSTNFRFLPRSVALRSGTSERASGMVSLPEPNNPSWGSFQLVDRVIPVGDLDADGVPDLMTQSSMYVSGDSPGAIEIDGPQTYERSYESPLLNVYFGGGAIEPPR